MKILITGSTGFIGKNLLSHLDPKKYKVTLLNRRVPDKPISRFKYIVGDLNNQKALEKAVLEQDAVIHLAGCVKAKNQAAFDHVNVSGTENLLNAVTSQNPKLKKFILISSLAAAGPSTAEKPKKESDTNQPISLYGLSKDRSEKAFLKHAYAGEKIVLRPPIVYGPHDYQLLDLFKILNKGLYIKMQGKEKHYSMVFVEDFCQAIIHTVNQKTVSDNSIYYVSDPNTYSMEDIAKTFKELAGINKLKTVSLPKLFFKLTAKIMDLSASVLNKPQAFNSDKYKEMLAEAWTCSPEKINKELGFQCEHDLKAGLKHAVIWYKNNNLL